MTAEKKQTIIRLVIFLLLATVPITIMVIAINCYHGELMFSTPELENHPVTNLFGIGMFAPALAAIITMLVTKQGFGSFKQLNFSLRNGNLKYYLLAFVPLVTSSLGTVIASLLMGADISTVLSTEFFADNLPMALMQLTAFIPSIAMFFGEEFGWRAYMNPLLEKLMGTPAAVIVGGVIWGLWHAPVTMSGHNFGVDYWGFPYLGILLMCLSCTFEGAFLMLLTRNTGSVIPACICHGCINSGAVLLMPFMPVNLITGEVSAAAAAAPAEEGSVILNMLPYSLPICIVGAVSFAILIRDCKKDKAEK